MASASAPVNDLLGPASTVLLIISVTLALGAIACTVAYWDRPRLRWARRIGGLATSQLLLVLAGFVLINQQIILFTHWNQVFGHWW